MSKEYHELFMDYTRLGIMGGLKFPEAVEFADNRLKSLSQKRIPTDFGPEETIAGVAFKSGQKLKDEILEKKTETGDVGVRIDGGKELGQTYQRSTMVTPSEEVKKAVQIIDKHVSEESQTSFDYLSESVDQPAPEMVNPSEKIRESTSEKLNPNPVPFRYEDRVKARQQ